jgi:hypothetical protein
MDAIGSSARRSEGCQHSALTMPTGEDTACGDSGSTRNAAASPDFFELSIAHEREASDRFTTALPAVH